MVGRGVGFLVAGSRGFLVVKNGERGGRVVIEKFAVAGFLPRFDFAMVFIFYFY